MNKGVEMSSVSNKMEEEYSVKKEIECLPPAFAKIFSEIGLRPEKESLIEKMPSLVRHYTNLISTAFPSLKPTISSSQIYVIPREKVDELFPFVKEDAFRNCNAFSYCDSHIVLVSDSLCDLLYGIDELRKDYFKKNPPKNGIIYEGGYGPAIQLLTVLAHEILHSHFRHAKLFRNVVENVFAGVNFSSMAYMLAAYAFNIVTDLHINNLLYDLLAEGILRVQYVGRTFLGKQPGVEYWDTLFTPQHLFIRIDEDIDLLLKLNGVPDEIRGKMVKDTMDEIKNLGVYGSFVHITNLITQGVHSGKESISKILNEIAAISSDVIESIRKATESLDLTYKGVKLTIGSPLLDSVYYLAYSSSSIVPLEENNELIDALFSITSANIYDPDSHKEVFNGLIRLKEAYNRNYSFLSKFKDSYEKGEDPEIDARLIAAIAIFIYIQINDLTSMVENIYSTEYEGRNCMSFYFSIEDKKFLELNRVSILDIITKYKELSSFGNYSEELLRNKYNFTDEEHRHIVEQYREICKNFWEIVIKGAYLNRLVVGYPLLDISLESFAKINDFERSIKDLISYANGMIAAGNEKYINDEMLSKILEVSSFINKDKEGGKTEASSIKDFIELGLRGFAIMSDCIDKSTEIMLDPYSRILGGNNNKVEQPDVEENKAKISNSMQI